MIFTFYKNNSKDMSAESVHVKSLEKLASVRCETVEEAVEKAGAKVGDIVISISWYQPFIDWVAFMVGEKEFRRVDIDEGDISPYISIIVGGCHVADGYIAVTRKVIKALRGSYKTFRAASKSTRREFIKQAALVHHRNRMVFVGLSQGNEIYPAILKR